MTGTPTAFRASGIVTDSVESYLRELPWQQDPLAAEVREAGKDAGVPIVSDDTARLLDLLVRMSRPRNAIEFGTAIGYSTLFIARAMPQGSVFTSFEIDVERHGQATDYLSRADLSCTVRLELGDARQLVEHVQGDVDFAFLDAAKDEYGSYLDLALERMARGGVIVVDNALMSGTVAANQSDGHWGPEAIAEQRAFNQRLVSDERLHTTVLPVGDGVGIAVVA